VNDEQRAKLARAQEIIGYQFENEQLLLSAITHPSATEGRPVKYSYERLEFLGDSILGAIVASIAFHRYHELDEGGLTRIKVALVSGACLSEVGQELGFGDVIVFGSSEKGTGKRGLHSALENVYEAIVAALYLDGGMEAARAFIERTLIPRMTIELASEPENPKSALQEKLQEDGITPTYKLIDTQGPPHDRTFVAQVFAGSRGLASGTGRTKKEAESQAAKSTLARLTEFFGIGVDEAASAEKQLASAQSKAEKQVADAQARAEKQVADAQARAEKQVAAAQAKVKKAQQKARRKAGRKRKHADDAAESGHDEGNGSTR
jgi:ribonuclease-3